MEVGRTSASSGLVSYTMSETRLFSRKLVKGAWPKPNRSITSPAIAAPLSRGTGAERMGRAPSVSWMR